MAPPAYLTSLKPRTARRVRQGATLRTGLAYSYDADDNLTRITDEVLASRTIDYAYDPADRLTRVDGDFGSVRREDFIHDANGNRIRVERRTLATDVSPAATDTYTRPTGTNRLASITTAAGTRTLTHDARGNLAGETRPGSVTATTSYDGYARLTGYTRTGEATLAMAYNGMDERVTLIRGGVTTRFIHDPDGRIIGEYTGGPTTPLSEYIWLLPETDDAGETGGDDGTGGWTPLAVTTANGAGGAQSLLWLHTNHLGTPIAASNASGTAQPLTGLTLPGFPGQLRTLADLYYNQHRDYDPTTGRYIQADPIGLAGDANPYLYAGGNPGRFVDPEGLERLPTDPSGLRNCWSVDPTHLNPNGTRFRCPDGNYLDYHRAQPGGRRHQGRNHWHYNGGNAHLYAGDEIPDCLEPDDTVENVLAIIAVGGAALLCAVLEPCGIVAAGGATLSAPLWAL